MIFGGIICAFDFDCSTENDQWCRAAELTHGHRTLALPIPVLQFVQEFSSTSIRFVWQRIIKFLQ